MSRFGSLNDGVADQPISPYRIFISHAGLDSWLASKIAERVREAGGAPLIDSEIIVTGDPIQKILEAIDQCEEAIFLFTPSSVESKWVMLELGAIWGQHKRINPIVEYVEPPIDLGVRYIRLNEIEAFLRELAKRIAARHPRQAVYGAGETTPRSPSPHTLGS